MPVVIEQTEEFARFRREDYEEVARLIRFTGEPALRAVLSNNVNVILSALVIAASK